MSRLYRFDISSKPIWRSSAIFWMRALMKSVNTEPGEIALQVMFGSRSVSAAVARVMPMIAVFEVI